MTRPWGGLNPALTSWRNGVNQRFPNRKRTSDGGYADGLHSSSSQHQADSDASVDAFDMDVNLLGSNDENGTTAERALLEALKKDFEADARSHLWIHDREISSDTIREWAERYYAGQNAHDHHVHWESQQSRERDGSPWAFTHTDALIRRMNGDDEVTPEQCRDIVRSEIAGFFRGGKNDDGDYTSRIGRDALGQEIPNPFRDGQKVPAWQLLEDVAKALKALQAPPVEPK